MDPVGNCVFWIRKTLRYSWKGPHEPEEPSNGPVNCKLYLRVHVSWRGGVVEEELPLPINWRVWNKHESAHHTIQQKCQQPGKFVSETSAGLCCYLVCKLWHLATTMLKTLPTSWQKFCGPVCVPYGDEQTSVKLLQPHFENRCRARECTWLIRMISIHVKDQFFIMKDSSRMTRAHIIWQRKSSPVQLIWFSYNGAAGKAGSLPRFPHREFKDGFAVWHLAGFFLICLAQRRTSSFFLSYPFYLLFCFHLCTRLGGLILPASVQRRSFM